MAGIALAACGGGSQTTPQPVTPAAAAAASSSAGVKPAGDASCQQAVDQLFAVTAAQEQPAIRDRAVKVFLHRCDADRWSVELRRCMAGVERAEDGDACERMLTPEQSRELRDELARELDAAGVKPEFRGGRPKAKAKAKAAPSAPGRGADPCEGGE